MPKATTARYLIDAGERVVATYVEAFAGALLLGGTLNISAVKAAALAGVVAGLSAVKSAAAKFLGRKDSASLVE